MSDAPERSKLDRLPPWAKEYIVKLEASTAKARADADAVMSGTAKVGRVYLRRWRRHQKTGEEAYVRVPLPDDAMFVVVTDTGQNLVCARSANGIRISTDGLRMLAVFPEVANVVHVGERTW